jgi:hypothetical protein
MSQEKPPDLGTGADPEDLLRRLLAEAVEPVRPAPGAQARLLARVRAHGARRGRERGAPHRLRWVAAGLATALVIVGATVIFAGRAGDGSGQSSATAGRAPASGALSSPAAPSAAAPAPAGRSKDLAETKSGQARAGRPGVSPAGAAGNVPAAASAPGPPLANALGPADLDADGLPDDLSVAGGTLVARLSHEGVQTVQLPATGPGARVLGVTLLDSARGGRVPVAFVRLQQRPGDAQDTAVSVVDGRLTVLRRGAEPVLLSVDPTGGYSCAGDLVIAGHPAGAYTVSGADLVPAASGAAVDAPVGKATGCGT